MAVATGALTTLTAVKSELSISSSTDDTYLEGLIDQVSEFIANYCNRKFHYGAAITEKVAGFGGTFLRISRFPLKTITSVAFNGATVDSSSYEIYDTDGVTGLIYSAGGWIWTTALATALTYDALPRGERKLYTVVYAGGYVTPAQVAGELVRDLPYDLEAAAIQLVTARYRRRGSDPSVTSESLMSYSVDYGTVVDTVPGLRETLNSYRIVAYW